MLAKQKVFFYKLMIFSALILTVALLLYSTIAKSLYFSQFPLQFILIFSITALTHLQLVKLGEQNMYRFTNVYIQVTVIKLIIYLVFILGCLMYLNVDKTVFALTFFVLYVLFSVFEVVHLLAFYKTDKP